MRIHKVTFPDVNNGLGCRITIWVSGCAHHCKGCHNPETWDFHSGREFTQEDKDRVFDLLSKPYMKGVTFSGGDPLCSYEEVLAFAKELKERFPQKDIWLYTGFTIEYIQGHMSEILDYIDYLVDGKYMEELRDITLAFRGSKNQIIWEKKNGEFVRSGLND